jgi:hypothetical protein
MAPTPGEGSPYEYDFSLDKAGQLPYFDSEEIAERTIWPAIDHLWRGDWRRDAYAGHEFTFPGRGAGLHESTVFDVVLSAACHGIPAEEEGDDDDIGLELGHTAIVQIEKIVTDGLRGVVFEHARKAEPSLMEALQDYRGLVAKTGIAYGFDTNEDAEINAFQSVEDRDGTVIWVSDRIDEHDVEEFDDEDEHDEGGIDLIFDVDRFHQVDLENIATVLSILDAPEYCLQALSAIEGQPLETD